MGLSIDLISQFAKITQDKKVTKKESTVYGTIVKYNGRDYVKMDGSELLTPVTSTTDVENDDRVTVTIKNHTATVTGNLSSPAARTDTVKDLGTKISEFEIVIADKVSTEELEAERARIDELVTENATIKGKLTASEAEIDELQAANVEITGTLTAVEAKIEELDVGNIDAEYINTKFIEIDGELVATNAKIYNLESIYGEFVDLSTDKFEAIEAEIDTLDAEKLTTESADVRYATIDFANIDQAAVEKIFSESGIIRDLIVSQGKITGELVGVTIKGDLIKGGTVIADKLVIKGSDGIYYKLNTDGETVESEQTEYNSLDGKHILAKSITATKVSVDDLVAFDATIGGFKITNNSIYSGVKQTVNNTTRGIYLDNDGQVAFGDAFNYLKYYRDQNGNYKLEIAAQSIVLGSGKTFDDVVDDITNNFGDINIGGRNLIRNSLNMIFADYSFGTVEGVIVTHDGEGNVTLNYTPLSAEDYGDGNVILDGIAAMDNKDGNVSLME